MAGLNELNLNDESFEVPSEEEIPEEGGSFQAMVQPGEYTIQFPDDISEVWSAFDTKDHGQRVSAWFGADAPCVVLDDEVGGAYKGSVVKNFSISNVPFKRKNDALVSDMQYLIRALEANLEPKDRSPLKSNQDFIAALQKHVGAQIKCSITWGAYCNPKKPIYMKNEEGRAEPVEGTNGCGHNFYAPSRNPEQEIPFTTDENGKKVYEERFEEAIVPGRSEFIGNSEDADGNEVPEYQPLCPASLIANYRLNRFRALTK